jgi:hypothetical protein
MHGTHLPLRTWFLAAHLVATHPKGISARQLRARLGIGSYKSAWFLLHRLREALADPENSALASLVEIDGSSLPRRSNDEPA